MPFAHLTIGTRDVEGTAAFFAEALQWKRVKTPRNTPIEAAWLEMAPGQQIHILGVEDFEVSAFEREFGRHVALFHPGGDLEALKERITAHGGELIDATRPTPFRRFFFRDPNGYLFEVIDQDRQGGE